MEPQSTNTWYGEDGVEIPVIFVAPKSSAGSRDIGSKEVKESAPAESRSRVEVKDKLSLEKKTKMKRPLRLFQKRAKKNLRLMAISWLQTDKKRG